MSATGATRFDVAVVGAGPAGLAAAATAAESGLALVVVDAGRQPGGQYWRHGDERGEDDHLADGHGHHDWTTYVGLRRRFERCRRSGTLTYLPETQVWSVQAPAELGDDAGRFRLRLTGADDRDDGQSRPAHVEATALILCPGGYDRQLPVPGWDLPGVMAAGGVQALLKGHGTLAGRRAVVAGTGPFLLPVAVSLAEAGAEVLGICEASTVGAWLPQLRGAVQVPAKGADAAAYAAKLLRHRIPYRTRTVVTAVRGESEATGVTVARLDRDGGIVHGSGRDLDVDLVALGWGFTPSLELLVAAGADTRVDVDGSLVAVVDDHQRTGVASVYAAGEATGVGGAMLAVQEGTLAGLAVVAEQGRGGPDRRRARRLQRQIARSRAFAAAMHRAHPVPARWSEWLTDDTTVCRCEEVTCGDIAYARDVLGAQDARTVKLLARPGMGWCQGQVCGFATARLAAAAEGRELDVSDLLPLAKRTICAPVSLSALALAGAVESAAEERP